MILYGWNGICSSNVSKAPGTERAPVPTLPLTVTLGAGPYGFFLTGVSDVRVDPVPAAEVILISALIGKSLEPVLSPLLPLNITR